MPEKQVEQTIALFRNLLKTIATVDDVETLRQRVYELEDRITDLEAEVTVHEEADH